MVDEHGPAGKANAAQQHEDERQHDAEHRMRVPQRIESQVPAVHHRFVTVAVGDESVRELVQAQRDDPGGEHEEERHDARGADSEEECYAGEQRDRDEPEEDRARAASAAGGAGGLRVGHEIVPTQLLPSQLEPVQHGVAVVLASVEH